MATNAGDIVTIPRSDTLPDPSSTALILVAERFQDVTEKAEELLESLVGEDGYLNAIDDAIVAAPTATISVPDITGTIATIDLADPPVWEEELDDYPETSIADPSLDPMPSVTDPGSASLSMPDEVNPTLDYAGITLPTDLYVALLARLVNDLESGATGLDEDVENAIMQRARDRQTVINDRNYDRVMVELDGMDFTMPTAALTAALYEQAQDDALADRDVNNAIMVQSSELAQKNSQFVIQVSKDLEQVLRTYQIGYNDVELRRAMAVVDSILRSFETRVNGYIAELQSLRDDMRIQVEHINAVVASNRGKVDLLIAQWNAYATQVTAITQKNKGKVDVFESMTSAYGTQADAKAKTIQAQADAIRIEVEKATLEVNAAIEEAKLALGSYGSEYGFRIDVAKEMAKIVAQVATGMQGVINASAGADYSGSESLSETFSHSDQLGESHNTNHDPDA